MPFRYLLAGALMAVPLVTLAASPNIEPGLWQFTSTTSAKGKVQVPDQTERYQECITREDLDDDKFGFLGEEGEGCEMLEHTVTAAGVDYRMVCEQQGSEARIAGGLTFLGNHTEGSVDVELDSPMGTIQMHTEIEGERTGEC